MGQTFGSLPINEVDDSTIEINASGKIAIKDDGVTFDKIDNDAIFSIVDEDFSSASTTSTSETALTDTMVIPANTMQRKIRIFAICSFDQGAYSNDGSFIRYRARIGGDPTWSNNDIWSTYTIASTNSDGNADYVEHLHGFLIEITMDSNDYPDFENDVYVTITGWQVTSSTSPSVTVLKAWIEKW